RAYWAGDSGSGAPATVFVTRLHVRYDNAHFPEDLVFQETSDRSNFQGRYVLRHAWSGPDTCAQAAEYRQGRAQRREEEAGTLARLPGWSLADIRKRMGLTIAAAVPARVPAWWERL